MLSTTSNIPVPPGYPQPSDAESVAVFCVSAGWDINNLFEHASLEEVSDIVKENVRKDVPLYDEETVERVANVILNAHLRDAIDRHDSPFFSPGIKKFLARWGEPVTKSDVLRTSFTDCALQIGYLLRNRSITQLAKDIADCKELDDPYRGNFCGYPASLISRILRELVSNGTISFEGNFHE